jgi:hypothetical protein
MPAPDGVRPLRLLHAEAIQRIAAARAKHDMQRMLVEIPLTDDERAAVESDQHAVVRLIVLLAGVATPVGPTPRQVSQDADRAGEQTPDPEGPSQP